MALQALDRYLETWNSRDPERWATSLNFPHVRPGPGAFELFKTPAQYAASVNFAQTLATGWHHSEWTTRRVLQLGVDKVHVAGSWLRYTEDGRQMVGTSVTYIVTNQDGRWGVCHDSPPGRRALNRWRRRRIPPRRSRRCARISRRGTATIRARSAPRCTTRTCGSAMARWRSGTRSPSCWRGPNQDGSAPGSRLDFDQADAWYR